MALELVKPAVEPAPPPRPENDPGVVAAGVYAAGRRICDTTIEDAGEWAKRPGHVVWIGLYEPSPELLRRVQKAVRPARDGDRGRRAAASAPKARAIWRGALHRRAHRAARRQAHRLRRNASLRRARLHRLGPARRLHLLLDGAPAPGGLPDRARERRRLHPLRHPRLHRRQLRAGDRGGLRRGRRDRGQGFFVRAVGGGDRAALHAAPRSSAAQERRRAADRGLSPAGARRSAPRRSLHAAALPRRDRPCAPRAGGDRFAPRGSGLRLRGEPDDRPGAAGAHHAAPRGLGGDPGGSDRRRRHLRHELRLSCPSCSGDSAISPCLALSSPSAAFSSGAFASTAGFEHLLSAAGFRPKAAKLPKYC